MNGRGMNGTAAKRLRAASLNGTGVLVALVTLFPILWMVSTAFKPSQEIYSLTPSLLPGHPTLGNYRAVISGQASWIGSYWLFFSSSELMPRTCAFSTVWALPRI